MKNNIMDYETSAMEIINYQNVWLVIILIALVGLIGLGIGIVKLWIKRNEKE